MKDVQGVAGNHQVEGQIEGHKPRASFEYVVRGPGIYDRGCATHLIQKKQCRKNTVKHPSVDTQYIATHSYMVQRCFRFKGPERHISNFLIGALVYRAVLSLTARYPLLNALEIFLNGPACAWKEHSYNPLSQIRCVYLQLFHQRACRRTT